MAPIRELLLMCWPGWAARDVWRWLMVAFGFLWIAHGVFSRNMRMRDSTTLDGWWRGKIATGWRELYMRGLFVLIGIGFITIACTFACP